MFTLNIYQLIQSLSFLRFAFKTRSFHVQDILVSRPPQSDSSAGTLSFPIQDIAISHSGARHVASAQGHRLVRAFFLVCPGVLIRPSVLSLYCTDSRFFFGRKPHFQRTLVLKNTTRKAARSPASPSI